MKNKEEIKEWLLRNAVNENGKTKEQAIKELEKIYE